ncbi:MAG TPA: sulfatase [bacterium]|nr:sulfatase [bacterium]
MEVCIISFKQPGGKMNLIFIMLDSLRQDHVSFYHQGKPAFPDVAACQTPNLDQLAASSIVFDNVYPCGLPTIPVRYELMTGYYSLPYRPWCALTPYDMTIADILRREDYLSAFITDTYHYRAPGMNYHAHFNLYHWVRGQEYDPASIPLPERKLENYVNSNYPEHWKRRVAQFLANTDHLDENTWFTARLVEKATEFLKKARHRNQKKIFLWFDSFEPHEPWDPPARFDVYTDKNYRGPRLILPMGGLASEWATPEEIRFIRGLYAGEVACVDYWVGQLLRALEELGYYEDSLLVLTADHGHPLADHGKFLKSADRMYSELLKVPFFLRLPQGKYGGQRLKALAQFPDVLPTILEILGYQTDTIPMGGQSFAKLIRGETNTFRKAIICGYHARVERCIRNEQWSYLQTGAAEPDCLFNLKQDPAEKENIIDSFPEVARELNACFGNVFRQEVPRVIKGIQGEYEMGSAAVE